MIIVNTDCVVGYNVSETLGLVKGNTVQTKHIGNDIVAGIRSLVGGEVHEYTDMLSESRKKSLARMVEDAEGLGADAVVNVRFVTSQIMSGASELLAYGTAVKLERKVR